MLLSGGIRDYTLNIYQARIFCILLWLVCKLKIKSLGEVSFSIMEVIGSFYGTTSVRKSGARSASGRRSPRPAPTPFSTPHPLGFCAAPTTRPTHAAYLHVGPRRPNITNVENRRRHQGEATECEKRDATFNLLLKHQNKTFATYACKQLKHLQRTSETLVKTHENA
jgi:hypothetical protein